MKKKGSKKVVGPVIQAENGPVRFCLSNAHHEGTVAAIRAGLKDVAAKRTKPARTALKTLARKFAVPTAGT
jgi:hypothetical protein